MKIARLMCIAFAVTLIAGWATRSYAGDKDKASASAAHASGVCTAEMAAKCTPEMAAACKAKMGATAAAQSSGMKPSAAVASANGVCNMPGMKASAAATKDAGCAGKASAASAAAHASCAMKGAAASASAGQCTGHGMGVMASSSAHADCEACVDMSNCSDALDAAGAHRQAVCLKNGVMYVFTADSKRNVSTVQTAVAHRSGQMARIASAGENARLCGECKALRGAMASGKLTREVVNVEGGSLTLITSSDPTIVAKLHAMADTKVAARIKS